MKRLFALMCLVSMAAGAADKPKVSSDGTPIGDRPVLVIMRRGPYPAPAPPKGAVLPLSEAMVMLYLDIPCHLPIHGRESMFRSFDGIGVGCWVPTLGGGFQTIHAIDGIAHQDSSFAVFETAVFHTDTQTIKIIDENAKWFTDSMSDDNHPNDNHARY